LYQQNLTWHGVKRNSSNRLEKDRRDNVTFLTTMSHLFYILDGHVIAHKLTHHHLHPFPSPGFESHDAALDLMIEVRRLHPSLQALMLSIQGLFSCAMSRDHDQVSGGRQCSGSA
jgi:hypothetical protein